MREEKASGAGPDDHPPDSQLFSTGLPPQVSAPIPLHSRHGDDHEVQPIPRVTQECKVIDAEASRQYLYEGLKGVYSSEGVSEMGMVTQGMLIQVQGSALEEVWAPGGFAGPCLCPEPWDSFWKQVLECVARGCRVPDMLQH